MNAGSGAGLAMAKGDDMQRDVRLPAATDRAPHAVLFDADGNDREVSLEQLDLDVRSERQLLWVDLPAEDAQPWLRRLGLEAAMTAVKDDKGKPRLQNFGEWFLLRVDAIADPGTLAFPRQPLILIVGHNVVVTVHRDRLEYLNELRDRERADTQLGVLSAERFTAAVLDWQMTTYFDAVATLEAEVDRLEVQLLTRRVPRDLLPDLARLRRAASRLRFLLAPHRGVYNAMARPDFQPDADEANEAQFRALNERFERSLDAVEATRDLVIGSFELFASRTAQRTNETMRVLTFVTVVLGSLAVIAGVLGMNFDVPFFKTGARGFIAAVASMGALVVAAIAVARWRRWW
jgi:Mg2+ and Co2+ transporter CorA